MTDAQVGRTIYSSDTPQDRPLRSFEDLLGECLKMLSSVYLQKGWSYERMFDLIGDINAAMATTDKQRRQPSQDEIDLGGNPINHFWRKGNIDV